MIPKVSSTDPQKALERSRVIMRKKGGAGDIRTKYMSKVLRGTKDVAMEARGLQPENVWEPLS